MIISSIINIYLTEQKYYLKFEIIGYSINLNNIFRLSITTILNKIQQKGLKN